MTTTRKVKFEYDDQVPLDLSFKKKSKTLISNDNKDMNDNAKVLKTAETCTEDNLDESGIFIVPAVPPLPVSISERLLAVECILTEKLKCIRFRSPVEYVYNPIEYAFEVHSMYVRKYCQNPKKILFLGMNPGPWGMSQTGVPFGEITMVRDWLKLSGYIGKPDREQPDRKVTGFECARSEISGRRLWSLFRDLCGNPENFFQHAYLHNYCPIAMMDTKGRNITPAELKGIEQSALHSVCDEALVTIIKLLKVQIVVGIGKFAEKRAQTVVKAAGLSTQILCIPHPSPRSLGNENWNEKAAQRLQELDLLQFFAK